MDASATSSEIYGASSRGANLEQAYDQVRALQLHIVDILSIDYGVKVLPPDFDARQCLTPRYLRFPLELVAGETFYDLRLRETEIGLITKRPTTITIQDGVIWVEVQRKKMDNVFLIPYLKTLPARPGGYGAIGVGVGGEAVTVNFASDDKPHTLVSGTSGAGKSTLQKSIVASMSFWSDKSEVQFILADVKGGETFGVFDRRGSRLANLIAPMLTEASDISAAAVWMYDRMVERQKAGIRKPAIVMVVDEVADVLRMRPAVEETFSRIIERGRSAGCHLILATNQANQKRLKSLPGLIKFRITLSQVRTQDAVSATTLSGSKANRLGMGGDILLGDGGKRVQGFMVTDGEIDNLLRGSGRLVPKFWTEFEAYTEGRSEIPPAERIPDLPKVGRPRSDIRPEEIAACLAYREKHGKLPSVSAISRNVLALDHGMNMDRAKRLLAEAEERVGQESDGNHSGSGAA